MLKTILVYLALLLPAMAASVEVLTPASGLSSVPTIARLSSKPAVNGQTVFVRNYAIDNDGGGGTYYFVTGDTTVADGTLIVTGIGGRWHRTWASALAKTSVIGGTDIDWTQGTVFTKTLSGNTTFTFTHPDLSRAILCVISNPASYTVTWPATIAWSPATPSQSSSNTDTYLLYNYDGTVRGHVDQIPSYTAGDLFVATNATRIARLPLGTDNYVLTADSAQALKVKWASPGSYIASSAGTGTGITLNGPTTFKTAAGSAVTGLINDTTWVMANNGGAVSNVWTVGSGSMTMAIAGAGATYDWNINGLRYMVTPGGTLGSANTLNSITMANSANILLKDGSGNEVGRLTGSSGNFTFNSTAVLGFSSGYTGSGQDTVIARAGPTAFKIGAAGNGGSFAFPMKTYAGLVNGANTAAPLTNGFVSLTAGPSAAFTIHGIVAGYDGQEIRVKNNTGQLMTIAHQSGTEGSGGNRIITPSAADVLCADGSTVVLIYNGSRWELITRAAYNIVANTLVATNGVTLPTAAPLTVSSGTNKRAGNATLVAGTVTVANTTVTANTLVILSPKTAGGTLGTYTYTVSAATSFTINSSNALDTSVISYLLIENP